MDFNLPNGIRLTGFEPADADALVEWLAEKEISDRTLRIPYPYTADDAENFLFGANSANKRSGEPVIWAIRREDGRLIGVIGFDSYVVGRAHQAEFGYWLAKPYWGQGIVTAAVRAVCEYAFANFDLVKITAHVFAFNEASSRVLEKCGFQQEGYLRKHRVKDGQFIDSKLFGRLK